MSTVQRVHEAVKQGDVVTLRALLSEQRALANSVSETDARGTYPLHVAAEFGQPEAAKVLIEFGADVTLREAENDSIALTWAAFFGRPEVLRVLLEAGSDQAQRNKHGLTPLGCAIGGTEGKWQRFSNATLADWRRAADILRQNGAAE